ncbi:MAG: hypothetical protein Ct9H300mP28_00050 [Pseudomonadota bacterium]|nr:MAG: hypothetical protein Ct9H300mP28_00050 [Pseudomonadota bacterium]
MVYYFEPTLLEIDLTYLKIPCNSHNVAPPKPPILPLGLEENKIPSFLNAQG